MSTCCKTHAKIKVPKRDIRNEFCCVCRVSSEKKKKLLKVKLAVALQSESGRVPKEEAIEQVTVLARVMCKEPVR
jgi:hypothetical protein